MARLARDGELPSAWAALSPRALAGVARAFDPRGYGVFDWRRLLFALCRGTLRALGTAAPFPAQLVSLRDEVAGQGKDVADVSAAEFAAGECQVRVASLNFRLDAVLKNPGRKFRSARSVYRRSDSAGGAGDTAERSAEGVHLGRGPARARECTDERRTGKTDMKTR